MDLINFLASYNFFIHSIHLQKQSPVVSQTQNWSQRIKYLLFVVILYTFQDACEFSGSYFSYCFHARFPQFCLEWNVFLSISINTVVC